MTTTDYEVNTLGPKALVIDLHPRQSPASLGRRFASGALKNLVDIVIGATSLTLVFSEPVDPNSPEVLNILESGAGTRAAFQPRLVEVPVVYNGPDLLMVAQRCGITTDELIHRHSSVEYVTSFIGFSPGFAYLVGLDPSLVLPRRTSPRPKISKGSVAIADRYTAVYPSDTPGGWHILGSTKLEIFNPEKTPPTLFLPGDLVKFVVADDTLDRTNCLGGEVE